jgi:membrane protein DedA with SNARE-associated domain
LEHVLNWVSTYGYGAVFTCLVLGIVGLPLPDEWLLVFTGYLIWRGRFHPVWGVLVAFCGSACGITLSYTIGRTLGLGFVHRYGRWFHITEEHTRRVHDWFNRVGHWALFFGYFVPGVRHFTAIVAGASKLEFRSFASYAWPGGLLWVGTFISIGYFLGDRWQRVFDVIDHNIRMATLVGAVFAAIYLAYRCWTPRPPRKPDSRQ